MIISLVSERRRREKTTHFSDVNSTLTRLLTMPLPLPFHLNSAHTLPISYVVSFWIGHFIAKPESLGASFDVSITNGASPKSKVNKVSVLLVFLTIIINGYRNVHSSFRCACLFVFFSLCFDVCFRWCDGLFSCKTIEAVCDCLYCSFSSFMLVQNVNLWSILLTYFDGILSKSENSTEWLYFVLTFSVCPFEMPQKAVPLPQKWTVFCFNWKWNEIKAKSSNTFFNTFESIEFSLVVIFVRCDFLSFALNSFVCSTRNGKFLCSKRAHRRNVCLPLNRSPYSYFSIFDLNKQNEKQKMQIERYANGNIYGIKYWKINCQFLQIRSDRVEIYSFPTFLFWVQPCVEHHPLTLIYLFWDEWNGFLNAFGNGI